MKTHDLIGEIHEHERDKKTNSLGLANHGFSFIRSAELLLPQEIELAFPDPIIFLALHGIELQLKGFLRTYGVTLRELHRFGHKLEMILGASLNKGLEDYYTAISELERYIKTYGKAYQGKRFEYLVTGRGHGLQAGLVAEGGASTVWCCPSALRLRLVKSLPANGLPKRRKTL
jgi:hypothetical protein